MVNTSILVFCIAVFFISCGGEHVHTYRLAKTKPPDSNPTVAPPKSETGGLSWNQPDGWLPTQGSNMRLASFDIPYSGGVGDLSVVQLSGTGGGLAANVNRWRRQLNLEPLSLSEIEKKIKTREGRLGNYQLISIISEKSESAFLCAIFPAGEQTLFVKLAASPLGIKEIESDFNSFCSSLKITF